MVENDLYCGIIVKEIGLYSKEEVALINETILLLKNLVENGEKITDTQNIKVSDTLQIIKDGCVKYEES